MVARIITLVAALLVAAVGAALVILYARQADERAVARYQPVEVVVAGRDLPEGTVMRDAFGQGYFTKKQVWVQDVVNGAIRGDLPAELQDQVLAVPLYQGEQLSTIKLTTAASVNDRLQLEPVAADGSTPAPAPSPTPRPDGRNAVTVPIDEGARGTAFLEPGRSVAVFVSSPALAGPDDPEGSTTTCVLLSKVEILAIGTQTVTDTQAGGTAAAAGTDTGTTGGTALVTIDVDPQTASQLILAQQVGSLYFVNLPSTSSGFPEGPNTCRTTGNLFNEIPGLQ